MLLHGTGDNAHMWDDFSSSVAGRFKVIALDQRGHGESDWVRPPAYRCEDYVNDLDQVIKALELPHPILMGHSMGALHATRYAAVKGASIAALIHVDIEPRPPSWNRAYLRDLYHSLPASYGSVQEVVRGMEKASPYATEETLHRLASFALREGPGGKLYNKYDREVLDCFDHYDLRKDLPRITCPSLIIRGAQSRVMRKEAALEMEKAIPKSRYVEIPRSTHQVPSDNPGAFREAVVNFLKRSGLVD